MEVGSLGDVEVGTWRGGDNVGQACELGELKVAWEMDALVSAVFKAMHSWDKARVQAASSRAEIGTECARGD